MPLSNVPIDVDKLCFVKILRTIKIISVHTVLQLVCTVKNEINTLI